MGKQTMNQLRQGDVLLVAVEKTPPDNTPVKSEVILAEGEITGHAHRLTGLVLEWSEDGQRYIYICGSEKGKLSHEEHDPVPVAVVAPNVTYQVIQQTEWDLKNQWRKVQD
jgi:hypothetical protein